MAHFLAFPFASDNQCIFATALGASAVTGSNEAIKDRLATLTDYQLKPGTVV